MSFPVAVHLGIALLFGAAFCAIGVLHLVYAKWLRDRAIKRMMSNWYVVATRVFGGIFVLVGTLSAWSMATMPLEPRYPNLAPKEWTGAPVVKDEQGAVRIARALSLAQTDVEPLQRTEAEWMAACKAELRSGVWHVQPRAHRSGVWHALSRAHRSDIRPITRDEAVLGYCTGAADFTIGAQDGRYLGELFVD